VVRWAGNGRGPASPGVSDSAVLERGVCIGRTSSRMSLVITPAMKCTDSGLGACCHSEADYVGRRIHKLLFSNHMDPSFRCASFRMTAISLMLFGDQ
jgi:hypothetical protein